MSYRPLADEIRPTSLDEVVGQRHVLGEKGLLRRIIEGGDIPNLVFYGPSGTGKTTVANIIAQRTNRPLHRLNATTASISDIKDIMGDIGTMLAPDGVLLYLDEIQYFNKKQQQSLLEFMENGKITLIASTTENPYFYVYNAVLSRSTVFEFKPVEPEDVLPAVDRGIAIMEGRLGATVECEEGVCRQIASACGGDVRKAMNAVELLLNSSKREEGKVLVTLADAKLVAQRSAMRYDRAGDDHYDILSALQKSIRGSDPDAGLHYLARLLTAGDLISACRRLMVIAAEDVGLAYPQAVPIVKACIDAANMLGGGPHGNGPQVQQRLPGHPRRHGRRPGGEDGGLPPPPPEQARRFGGHGAGTGISLPPRVSPPLCQAAVLAGYPQRCQVLRVRREQDRAGRQAVLGRDQG